MPQTRIVIKDNKVTAITLFKCVLLETEHARIAIAGNRISS